jgi:hypothetical protein
MKSYRKRLLALASLMLLVLLAWLLWPDRRMAQAKALQKELTGPNGKSLSPEQRREKWQQYRKLTQKLTPAQRAELSKEARQRRQEELARYFRLSKAEKNKYLDDRIDAMEKRRKQMQANSNGKGGPGGNGQGPSGGNGSFASGPQAGNRDRSTAARDQGRQDRLDSTSPAERAMFTQFRQDLNARRAQRGLQPMGGGPR